MQISLTNDQINNIKNRYYSNLNDAASVDYDRASTYYDIYKLVGNAFSKFLADSFGYDEKRTKRAELMSQARQMFTSRRVWMRVNGYKGVEKLMTISDEDKRNKVLSQIRKPAGVVNFSISDLDALIQSDGEIALDSINIFTGLTKSRSQSRSKGRKSSQQRSRKQPQNVEKEVRKQLQQALGNLKTRRSRQTRSQRRTANV